MCHCRLWVTAKDYCTLLSAIQTYGTVIIITLHCCRCWVNREMTVTRPPMLFIWWFLSQCQVSFNLIHFSCCLLKKKQLEYWWQTFVCWCYNCALCAFLLFIILSLQTCTVSFYHALSSAALLHLEAIDTCLLQYFCLCKFALPCLDLETVLQSTAVECTPTQTPTETDL